MELRRALVWLLSLGLAATVARQACDFMGHLWLPIGLNFLHILALILGLFGVLQRRPSFIVSFAGWSLLWMGWNAFLIAYYLKVGQLDRDDGVLGFGARGSHSFWVEHTPLCRHAYDYSAREWRAEDCYLPFYYVETMVALVHLFLALPSLALALAFLYRSGRKSAEAKAPRVQVEFTSPPHPHHQHHPVAPFHTAPVSMDPAKTNPGYSSDTSAFEVSSGYLNTSYEPNSPSPMSRPAPLIVAGDVPVPRRASKKKKKKKAWGSENLIGGVTEESVYREFHLKESGEDPGEYSLATTAELADGARRRRGGGPSSSTRESGEARAARRRERKTRSVSPPHLRRPSSQPLNHNQTQNQQAPPALPPSQPMHHYRQRSNSNGKQRRAYRHYAGKGQSQQAEPLGGSQPNMLGVGIAAVGDPEGDVLAYTHEPRRLSVTEPRGIRNSTDSALNPSQAKQRGAAPAMKQPLTSLVSFDPKSATLIRYHEHLRSSGETTRDDSMEDSPPLQLAPHPPISPGLSAFPRRPLPTPASPHNLISDRTSYDSGIPSSLGQGGGGSEGSSTSSQPSSRESDPQPPLKSILSSRHQARSHHPFANPLQASRPNFYEPPTSQGPPHITTNPAFRPSHLHQHGYSDQQEPTTTPAPPPLTPLREGVLMALEEGDSMDSSFSIPPPPPPQPEQQQQQQQQQQQLPRGPSSQLRVPQPPPSQALKSSTPSAFFLPPLSAQLSSHLQRSADDLRAETQHPPLPPSRIYAPRSPAPLLTPQQPLIHDHSLLV